LAAATQSGEFLDHENPLNGETKDKLNEFFGSFANAANPLLLLDYDGTLAPFRVDRFKAKPWAGVRELLKQIQNQTRTRIVVVTGRPAGEIVALLGVKPAPEVWGLHGSERLHPGGRRDLEQLPRATLEKLSALRARLRHDSAGGLLEEKPNAIVMHWRGVAPQKARVIAAKTRALFEPLAQMDGMTLLEFEAGIELRAGRDKGKAVKFLLDETRSGGPRPAAYLGDDVTDETAFRAMKGRGLGVLVRRKHRETAADIWLQPPQELREFLSRWLDACRAGKAEPILE
jgi:trehalose 6-phosphate phosphatase